MTALLTDNLPLLSGAPNGIKKLRELILELAVRGKLVPQNPNDRPIEPLLNASRIARTKAMAEGKIKKEKSAAEIIAEEQPFKLPNGWVWCRIVDTGDYINGLAFKPSDWSGSGRPIIRIQNLSGRNSEFNRTEREVDASIIVNEGDILVSWSATLDTYIWSGEQGVLNQHIFRVSPSKLVFEQYLYWLLKWTIRILADSDHAHGLVMAHINRGPFLAQPVGIPPLEEQKRIVEKVVELMALCDRLEAQQSDAESAHARLVQALLDSLTQASDATDFAASWKRLAEHFHTLFTTEPSIDTLKQTLLQLAVMGKLAPQDLSEDSTSFHSFGAEAPKLADEKIALYSVPFQWRWINLCDLLEEGRDISYGVIKLGTEPKQGGVPTLRCSDVKPGYIDLRGVRRVAPDIEQDYVRTRLRGGEILINIRGTLGGVAVVDKKLAGYNVAREVAVVPLNPKLNAQYLSIAMQSSYFWQRINQQLRGIAYKGLNLGALRLFPIPIPPVAEQNRIVAKVDQLMALCDQLKTRLTQARQLNEQLASTLVEQSVA